jgi:hypothetical protein
MLNRDIVGLRILFWFGLFASGTAFSQVSPMPPFLPSSPEQCQKFAQQVSEFYAEMRTEHQKCLDDAAKFSKPTPESNQNSMICSQPTCQNLHNYVYGHAEADSQQQVQDCEKSVQRRMQEDAEYKERMQKRAAERAKDEEDERTKRDGDENSSSVSKPSSAKSSGASSRRSEPQEEEDAKAQVSTPSTVIQQTPKPDPTLADPYERSGKKDSSPDASVVDPYATSVSAGGRKVADVVDPYGKSIVAEGTPSVVDPYGSEAREETATSRVRTEISANSGRKSFEIAVEAGEKKLAADIANAPNTLSGKKLQAYLGDANDLKGIMKGMGWMLEKSEYAVDAAGILKANNADERTGAEAQLGLTFAKDVASKGFSTVATKLFPEAAAVLSGPVGWVAFVGQQVLVPTEISREPTEIIRDNSGHTSLPQKQEALFQMWKQYEKFGANWKEPQERELLQNTEIVYQQALSH